ncbi:MAG: substrate-binding domain-containing protein [Eubacteriaceae bacterium]|jgi:phosphate transport system substrate-binding protein|nr:substrate-binding domain-containing protein [Eubacteriaceae bacterium]
MKKFAILLAALMLVASGCGGERRPPNTQGGNNSTVAPQLSFTEENYPRIDGSTANIPLAEELLKIFLGYTDEQAEDAVDFRTTPYAYMNLANKECELLLVYEASEETKSYLEGLGADFEYYPIGLDALVFIVNENNPVNNLTSEQIKAIYTGDIKNWSEVGGEDAEILAFQRDATSGSQALMDKLVMQGTPMAQAPMELMPSAMGMLIEQLAEYSNESTAIGYSVYYYASLMYTKPELKFIDVNGVKPSNDTIKSNGYPYTNSFFAVIRSDEPEDSPARQMAEWLCTSEGKAVIEQCGYVAVE